MKRNPRLEEILPFWPLFIWKQCCSCGQEFRWEKGWYKIDYLNRENTRVVCSDCAPDKETALKVLDKYSF